LTETFLHTIWEETKNLDMLFQKDKLIINKDMKWYLSVYGTDTTIQAMCSSLCQIHKFAKAKGTAFHLTYDWCIENIKFWYFEVNKTSQGEELYITMNSRGEQLTGSEQIKPLLFAKAKGGNVNWGKKWDDWEEFFFSLARESGKEIQDISIVEKAMEQFIKVVIELRTCKEHKTIVPIEDSEKISLNDIEEYFGALERLKNLNNDIQPKVKQEVRRLLGNKTGDMVTDDHLLILKSLLVSSRRNLKDERDYLRLLKIIANGLRRHSIHHGPFLTFLERFSKSDKCLYDFIEESKKEKSPDVFDLDKVFDEHELNKIKIYHATGDTEIEDLFWEAEEEPYTQGFISCIWDEKFTNVSEWHDGDKAVMKERLRIFRYVFSEDHTHTPLSEKPKNGKIDNALITRALLAILPGDYSYQASGNNRHFGYRNYWSIITKWNPEAISSLIDKLYQCGNNDYYYTCMTNCIEQRIQSYHKDLTPKDGMYYVLKYDDSLQALWQGYNILHFNKRGNDRWKDYRIDLLHRERYTFKCINLFRYLVFKHLPEHLSDTDKSREDIVSNPFLEMKNGLKLDCAENHGWRIYNKQGDSSENIMKYRTEIERRLGADYSLPDGQEEKYLEISIDTNKDLIEAGIDIVKRIHDASPV
jgi:hypothetical protein